MVFCVLTVTVSVTDVESRPTILHTGGVLQQMGGVRAGQTRPGTRPPAGRTGVVATWRRQKR